MYQHNENVIFMYKIMIKWIRERRQCYKNIHQKPNMITSLATKNNRFRPRLRLISIFKVRFYGHTFIHLPKPLDFLFLLLLYRSIMKWLHEISIILSLLRSLVWLILGGVYIKYLKVSKKSLPVFILKTDGGIKSFLSLKQICER